MFRGSHPEVGRVVRRAVALARGLESHRTGSEHLLLALTEGGGPVGTVLTTRGVTRAAVERAIRLAPVAGAGAAADREALAALGVDLDGLSRSDGIALVDRLASREPRFPLGVTAARRRCARMRPPLGLDAQAVYEASLRLALARREHEHRTEHVALALAALDPGVSWVLATAGVDGRALLADLSATFPPPRRNRLLRAERRIGQASRHNAIVRRYQRTTGRVATAGPALGTLIVG